MRRVVSVLIGLVLFGTAVAPGAISNGPGGRMYFAGLANTKTNSNSGGYPGTNDVLLKSVVINADWTLSGSFQTHGVLTNHLYQPGWAAESAQQFSPEVETGGGRGYGKVIMGLYYNNSPVSTYHTNATWNVPYKTNETMDILRVSPSDGGMTVNVIGDGRPVAAGGSTDCGLFCLPDPEGAFVGASGGYLIEGFVTDSVWDYRWETVRDTGSGDVTASDSNYRVYTSSLHITWDMPLDCEILGNRMYWIAPWSGILFATTNGTLNTLFGRDPTSTGYPSSHLAMGRVTVNGQQRDAAWYWSYDGLWRSVDTNGDGLATSPGESTNLCTWSQATTAGMDVYGDMELITGNDGKQFLVGVNVPGNSLGVMELNADGSWSSNYAKIALGTAIGNGTYYLGNIEFDPYRPSRNGSVVLLK